MKLTRIAFLCSTLLLALPAVPALAQEDPEEQGGRPLGTVLRGDEEVPGPGDEDGSGSVEITLNHGQGQVRWDLHVENIATATAAHIYQAEAGASGPVVVPLTPPADGSSKGCADVDRELIKGI